jgi:hypothetical protein
MKTLNGLLLGRGTTLPARACRACPLVVGMLSEILVLFRDGAAWLMRCIT